MIAAVESYLAVRRAAGFTLRKTEYLLRSFAAFATDRTQTHIRTATAIDWAGQAGSVEQRHTRYQTICHFAQYLRVEDARHELPPANHFGYRKTRRIPRIYSRDEIASLVLAATRLPSSDSFLPKTYAALISLLAATGLRISEALHLLVSHHAQRFANPQNQVSENPIGAHAPHRCDRTGPLLDEPAKSETRWRPCLRFGQRATARVLESSQRVPDLAEISGYQALRQSAAAYS
jgi:hypothetical protein